MPWVKVQNFKNPELQELKSKILHYAYKIITNSCLIGQLSLDKQLRNQTSYSNLPDSVC